MSPESVMRGFGIDEQALAMCKRFTLQHPVFNTVRIEWATGNLGEIKLQVTAYVPDRETAQPMPLHTVRTVATHALLRYEPKDFLAQFVRTTIRELIMHEVDEMLLLDGIRIKDPHKP